MLIIPRIVHVLTIVLNVIIMILNLVHRFKDSDPNKLYKK